MRAILATILLALCVLPAAAHGRHRHHFRRHHAVHHVAAAHGHRRPVAERLALAAPVTSPSLVRTAMKYLGARHSPSGFRGEWCGDFMGVVARQDGYRIPVDYRLARSWAHAGPRTSAHPGAIFVERHHVGIVMQVIGKFVELLSGNHGHKVGIGLYPIGRAIAFVEPVRG